MCLSYLLSNLAFGRNWPCLNAATQYSKEQVVMSTYQVTKEMERISLCLKTFFPQLFLFKAVETPMGKVFQALDEGTRNPP